MNGSDNSNNARHGRERARTLPTASPRAVARRTVRAEPGCHSGRIAVRALLLLLVAAIAAVPVPSLAADEPGTPELQVKAAFLINFPKYVTWPPEAFADTNSPVVVAVLGDSRLAEELGRMTADRVVEGRPFVVKMVGKDRGVPPGSHLLFIADAERQHAADLLQQVKKSNILTVGESDGFLDRGGVVNFVRRDRKIRLEINLAAARQAHLTISSKLLNLADLVRGKTE
jgi:hypothetical protein